MLEEVQRRGTDEELNKVMFCRFFFGGFLRNDLVMLRMHAVMRLRSTLANDAAPIKLSARRILWEDINLLSMPHSVLRRWRIISILIYIKQVRLH